MTRVERRVFLAGTLALLAAPLAVEAQPAGKVYRIGFLATFPPAPGGPNPLGDAFLDGLREHGYVEGQNLTIERRFSEGKADRLPTLVADLLRLDVRLIVALSSGPSLAAKIGTTTVPIVFVGVSDPIGTGLVASLARPGGNVTGLATIEWEAFSAKHATSHQGDPAPGLAHRDPQESDQPHARTDRPPGTGSGTYPCGDAPTRRGARRLRTGARVRSMRSGGARTCSMCMAIRSPSLSEPASPNWR